MFDWISRTIAIVAVSVLAAATARGDFTLSDGTFADTNWSLSLDPGGPAGIGLTESGAQSATGGNPGSYRRMTESATFFTDAGIFHQYLAGSYNPAVSGAISSIDYTEDHILFSKTGDTTVKSIPALLQNGLIYFSAIALPVTSAAWTTATESGLDSTTFSAFSSQPPTPHPDFSASGGVITFGYLIFDNGTGLNATTTHGIDNWAFTVHTAGGTVPEPGSALLLGLGAFACVLARRRASRTRSAPGSTADPLRYARDPGFKR